MHLIGSRIEADLFSQVQKPNGKTFFKKTGGSAENYLLVGLSISHNLSQSQLVFNDNDDAEV